MRLRSLQLENFRNYKELSLDLSKEETVAFVGQNAQGKTNILEAVAFLALGKSFRADRFLDSLHWDREHGRIRGTLDDTELEVFLSREPRSKKVKKNQKVARPRDFLGHLHVVLFTPDSLLMISEGPRLRRQFFDRLLVQVNPLYLDSLTQMERILKQRNALLKRIREGIAQVWELEVWDARLVTEAEKIWKARLEFKDFLSKKLATFYKNIASGPEQLEMDYSPRIQNLAEDLLRERSRDLARGTTSVGPHRDDFLLRLDKKILKDSGSRGECRSAVLALKAAEIRYIEEKTGLQPLLLLDDVFSELDEERQSHLGQLIEGYQTLISTTSLDHLKGLKNLHIITVKDGQLTL